MSHIAKEHFSSRGNPATCHLEIPIASLQCSPRHNLQLQQMLGCPTPSSRTPPMPFYKPQHPQSPNAYLYKKQNLTIICLVWATATSNRLHKELGQRATQANLKGREAPCIQLCQPHQPHKCEIFQCKTQWPHSKSLYSSTTAGI